jgi:SAM-dependent methyltransferase
VCNRTAKPDLMLSEVELWRCETCGHCFSNFDSAAEMETYDHDYYQVQHRRWFENPNYALFKLISRLIQSQSSSCSVLDVGCGQGEFLRYLHKQGIGERLTGIDLSTEDLKKEGILFIKGDMLKHDFYERYDLVVSLATVEHVTDVVCFAQRLYELCLPGGYVVVMTVNERGMPFLIAHCLARLGISFAADRLYEKHHLNHFTVSSLRQLMIISGFEVENTLFHNVPLAAVDIPGDSQLIESLLRAAVLGVFAVGWTLHRKMLFWMWGAAPVLLLNT